MHPMNLLRHSRARDGRELPSDLVERGATVSEALALLEETLSELLEESASGRAELPGAQGISVPALKRELAVVRRAVIEGGFERILAEQATVREAFQRVESWHS